MRSWIFKLRITIELGISVFIVFLLLVCSTTLTPIIYLISKVMFSKGVEL